MAPLPSSRPEKSVRVFGKCSVDYAQFLTSKITQRIPAKNVCLFTCSATRAVNLEMASSLSSTGFLNASSRMVATRGPEEDRTKSQAIIRETL